MKGYKKMTSCKKELDFSSIKQMCEYYGINKKKYAQLLNTGVPIEEAIKQAAKSKTDSFFLLLGERLFVVRHRLGLSQKEMGKLVGIEKKRISMQMISMIENGKESLPLDNYIKLSNETGLTLNYLLCIDDESRNRTPSLENATIGERIKADRKERGMTQYVYASEILNKGGVYKSNSPVVVSGLETGSRRLTTKKLVKLAETTGISADWFVGLTDEKSFVLP